LATFTPPTVRDVHLAGDDPTHPGYRLFRHFAPTYRGVNVYIRTDTTVTEDDATHPDDVDRVFLGGRTYTDVSAAHEALLTAAGYTVT